MSQQAPKQQLNLDTLQSMINAILIETGKALRSANKRGAKTIAFDNERLKSFIPSAIDKFHAALDELESDIVRARAVLARDLRELQFQPDHEESAVSQQPETVQPPADSITETFDTEPAAVAISQPQAEDDGDMKVEDVVMQLTDATQPLEIEQPSVQIPTVVRPDAATETMRNIQTKTESEQAQTVQPEPEKGAAEEPPQADGESMATTNEPTADGSSNQNVYPEQPAIAEGEVQSASNEDNMNFESLFDTDVGTSGSGMNFDDFDFTVGGSNSPNQQFAQDEGGLDLSSFGNDVNTTTNEDITSMLQDLGNYSTANQTGGLGGLSEMQTSGAPASGVGQQDGTTDANDFGMGDSNPVDTTFDDLLNGMDFGEAGDVTADDDMMHELDDAFFGLGSSNNQA